MSIDSHSPVTEIEGIGPIVARALARIRVFSVFDLMRCTPDQIRRAAPKHVPFQKAVALRAAASLLRIHGMTAQWAEGLVAGGVRSIEEFQRKSSRQVLEALRQARRRRKIRSLPTSDEIEMMLKDAVVLRYTGALLGTVLDAKGKAVRAAVVRIDREQQQTDARGRFQLLRLPLGRRLPLLHITHPRFQELVVEEPRISIDSDIVAVEIYKLQKKRARTRKDRAPPVVLSELNGDTLPAPTGQSFRVVPMALGRIESGDILMVQTIPKGQGPVTLVSRFKRFENGQFIVRTAKIPRDQFPKNLKERDHFRYLLGKFKPMEIHAEAIRKNIMLRMMRREFAEQRVGRSVPNRRRALVQRIRFLMSKGFFSGRLLRPGAEETPSQEGGSDDV